MLLLKPTEKQKIFAENLIKKDKKVYNNRSYRNGGVLLDSKLAEIVVCDYYKLKYIDDYHYDFVGPSGQKIDCKTKPCSDIEPKEDYNACVPAYQYYLQNCDYYLFVRINKKLDKVWVVGYISKEEFGAKSVFVKKGQKDPDSSKNKEWICPEDSFYIKIKELKNL